MNRYTVYRTYANGRDGESGFGDDLSAADQAYNDATHEDRVCTVELIDNADPNDPKTLKRYPSDDYT